MKRVVTRRIRDLRALAVLGRTLRAARAESGRTLCDVAPLVGVSFPHISGVERGRSLPAREVLMRLADVYSVPYAELHNLAVRALVERWENGRG